ncbi:MAG: SDR family oxidoreductase [Clostridia bacterium]|nr:SDR family oxidoreductase [Clostridia bacterium]
MEFTGKTAVLSGAASGMGLLTAKCFAKEGGNVVLSDVNPETLQAAVDEVNQIREGCAIGVPCDVRDYEQVCAVRDAAVETFGSIDLLVNWAGGAETRMLNCKGHEFPDTPIEVYDWGLDVNLKGQLHFDHAVMKQMREQKSGVIINIGSITGEEGCQKNVAYSAAKSGAMNGLTKSLALYGGNYGIRVCCISPGPVLTRPGMAKMKTLLGRAAEPQEMVDMVMYLASDKAAFITGVNFLMDGGRNVMRNKE